MTFVLLQMPEELRITVGNDKYRDHSEEPPGRRTEQLQHEDELYRRERELYGGERDRFRDYGHRDPYEQDRLSRERERDPYRRPDEREYGDRRGLGASGDYPPQQMHQSRDARPMPPQRVEHIFPAAALASLPPATQASGGSSRPLKSILKKKDAPPEPSPSKPSGLPGMANYIDDIEDEDKFLYGDDGRKDFGSSYQRPVPTSVPEVSQIRSAAHSWQPSSAPVQKSLANAVSNFVSDQRQYVEQHREPYIQQPPPQEPPRSEAGGDLWSMLAKTVQTVQQQSQLAPQHESQNFYAEPVPQAANFHSSFQPQQAPVPPPTAVQAPAADPTIENILKSIGFDFEMSKRMQEKAKHGGEAPAPEPKPADPDFNITENASFMGSGMSHEDLRTQFEKDKMEKRDERVDRMESRRGMREEKRGGPLQRDCSPVSDDGVPAPPMFNLPPITIKRKFNVDRRSPDWERKVRSRSRSRERSLERRPRSRSPSWSRSISTQGRHSPGQRRSPSPRRRTPSPRRRTPSPRRRTPSPRRRTPSPERRSSSFKRSPSPRRRSPVPQRARSPSPARAISPVIKRTFNLDGLMPNFRRRFSPGKSRSRSRERARSPGRRRSISPRRHVDRGRKRSFSRSRSRSRDRDRERKSRRSSSADRGHRRRSSSRGRRRSRSRSHDRRLGSPVSSTSSDSDVDGPANKKYFAAPLKLFKDNTARREYDRSPLLHKQSGPHVMPFPSYNQPPPMMSQGPPPGYPMPPPGMPPPGMPPFGPPPPGFPMFPPVSYASMPPMSIPPPINMPPPGIPSPQPVLMPPGTIEMPLELPKRTVSQVPILISDKESPPQKRSRSRSPERSKERKRSRSRSADKSRARKKSRSRSPEKRKSRSRSRGRDHRSRSGSRTQSRSRRSKSRDRKRSRSGSGDRSKKDGRGDSSRRIVVTPKDKSKSKADDKSSDRGGSKDGKDKDGKGTRKESGASSKEKVSAKEKAVEKERARVMKEKEVMDSKIIVLEQEFKNLKQQEDVLKKKQTKDSKPDPILVENSKLLEEIRAELVHLKNKRNNLMQRFAKHFMRKPIPKKADKDEGRQKEPEVMFCYGFIIY